MPNYVYNTIICKENLLSKILDEDKNVRFGILVPPPTTREQCIADYGEEYLDEIDENGHSTNYLDLRYDPEWFNWYKWNCHFWGTKWDAAESEVREENGYYYVSFTYSMESTYRVDSAVSQSRITFYSSLGRRARIWSNGNIQQ